MIDYSKIEFDEEKHSYTYDGVELVPVTTVVKTVKPVFDSESRASATALRENRTKQEVLDEWAEKGNIGRTRGSRLHQYVEDTLKGIVDPILLANPVLPEMTAFAKAWKSLQSLKPVVEKVEYRMCDIDLMAAGMFDILIGFPKDPKCIFDWKTGKYEVKSSFGPMLAPFNDLDDCQHSHYSVQTSLYRYMYEKNFGEKLGDNYLVHLDKYGDFHIHRGYDLRDRIEPWFNGKSALDMCGDPQSERQAQELLNAVGLFNEEQKRLTSDTKKDLRTAIKELIKVIS